MVNASKLDCTKCGACCRYSGEVLVNKLENVPRHLTRSIKNTIGFASYVAEDYVKMNRTKDNVCVAFKGNIGSDCKCGIYERRPDNCKDFYPGGKDCLDARKAAGLTGGN